MKIIQTLEAVQDLIAVTLCVGLFFVMALQMKQIFSTLLSKLEFHAITSDILFILILVELFRLLIIYLQVKRVSITVSVEVAIVSVLRVWLPPTFAGVNPGVPMAARVKMGHRHP